MLWLLNAAPLPSIHEPMIQFVARIAQANMGVLHNRLVSMLRREEMGGAGSSGQRLAIAILNKLTL